ncbi:flagellar basal-body MS-ring/collar protein FliF [Aureimonas mangrovi]|uniref:flagellar basal-body MS-ring/collar protein FliF n=1 Tax=Aureimonas mangrovi TaxID=2758041 RepID=UPI00163D3FB0|nr:flagellar basal-body MS-ring/collar protein FliF [Aureimonas mangrovi]
MSLVDGAQARKLLSNLNALGPRRLGGLALVGILVVALVSLGAYYLSKPDMETLYSGLDRQDVTRIGAALTEAGIPFDVNAAGDTVMTSFSQTSSARMLLAERGLPRSDNAGYELFDQIGSMGLTSFMQQVTRVRALEGEIARTVQTLRDVRAARVHIVLPEEGSFRRERQPPSASVVIRTDDVAAFSSAQAIRHLVASAIPGLSVDQVTVLSTDGTLLASGDDGVSAAPSKQLGMEGVVSRQVEDSIRRTLAPYLGIGNFQSSVQAKLNTDRRLTSARTFDPDTRVERSVRTVRETGQTTDREAETPTSVDQNVPQAASEAGPTGSESSEASERREELTNYEINETTVQTTSEGYDVERLSVAVVVNRARLAESIGEGATPEQMEAALTEIRALVGSAAGISEARGDRVEVTAVDFLGAGQDMEAVPTAGLLETMARQTGTLINAVTVLVVAVLVIWFGLKPAIRALTAERAGTALAAADGSEPVELATAAARGETGGMAAANSSDASAFESELLEDLTRSQARSPQARLERLIDFDEVQAASILKQWIHQKEAA